MSDIDNQITSVAMGICLAKPHMGPITVWWQPQDGLYGRMRGDNAKHKPMAGLLAEVPAGTPLNTAAATIRREITKYCVDATHQELPL